MTEAWSFLLTGAVFGLTGGLTPGPTLALVIAQTMRYGAREGIKIAVAPLLTDTPIVLATLLLLRAAGEARLFLGAVSLLGAVFLSVLSYDAFTARPVAVGAPDARSGSIGKGVLANLLNPAPYLFWLAVGAPTLAKAMASGVGSAVGFVSAFYACLVGAKVVTAVLVDRGRRLFESRAYFWILRALSLALLAFAVFYLRDAVRFFGPQP